MKRIIFNWFLFCAGVTVLTLLFTPIMVYTNILGTWLVFIFIIVPSIIQDYSGKV